MITSLHNRRVKLLRSLRLHKHRQQQGCFLAEGIRIVEEALAGAAPVETIVYAPDLLVSERAQRLVEQTEAARRLALSAEAFRSLSDRDDPQGIAALIRIEAHPLSALPLSVEMLVVVAYQLSDPGNLGSIIRTADAAGATGVIVVAPSVDLYDPQTVRATMGSLFALPVIYPVEPAGLERWVGEARAGGVSLCVVASSAHGRQDYFDLDYRRPLALLAGNERHGLPTDVCDRADLLVRLPMAGRTTSLNVSAATAAMVYEIVRQRRRS